MDMNAKAFALSLLKGVGQVMFQGNAITGLFFLLGIFYNSWLIGLGAILGVCSGTVAAHLLKFKEKDIENGLYGFNGVLVGIAIVYFFGLNAVTAGAVVVGAVLSTLVMNFMLARKWSPFTFPFVVSAWAVMLALSLAGQAKLFMEPVMQTSTIDVGAILGAGIGQVMFQQNVVTGVIFLLGILASSRISAGYAVLGAAIGALVGFGLAVPLAMINAGLFGYNAVLCGIALGGSKWKSAAYAVIAGALSSLILYAMMMQSVVPALTAPFVFATWIVLAVKGRIKQ
ncbi:MAG: urea transporter [Candidatus Burarchaeum sp.]|nr:urea transporter [Candidatus Burarchaeum sp.]MDO8339277.1 urea transporter [Candidatus Burarchaeum sp.]